MRSRALAVCARLADVESTHGTRKAGLEGRIVLITGGAKRVGAAICRRLHKAGASIMLHYRSSAGEARLLQAELNHIRPKSVALIQADLVAAGASPAFSDSMPRKKQTSALAALSSASFRSNCTATGRTMDVSPVRVSEATPAGIAVSGIVPVRLVPAAGWP